MWDRFFEIFLNIKYPLYVTKKKLTWTVVFGWLIAFLFAICARIFEIEGTFDAWTVIYSTVLVLDIIIVLSAIITYTYFFLKVRKIQKQVTDNNKCTRKIVIKRFKVPLLMVATFLLFNVISTVLIIVLVTTFNKLSETRSAVIRHTAELLTISGFMSDVVIYVFLQKNLRIRLLILLGYSKQENEIETATLPRSSATQRVPSTIKI